MLTPVQVKADSERPLPAWRQAGHTARRARAGSTTDQVSEALGRQMRMPAALQRHFDKADPAIVALLKPNLAARYMAIPLVAAKSGAKRIVVAMATPQDVLVIDDVSFALGARVEPMIASELSIARNLKRFYNIEIKLTRPARSDPANIAAGSSLSREIPSLAGVAPLASHDTLHDRADGGATSAHPLAPPPGAAIALEDAVHRLVGRRTPRTDRGHRHRFYAAALCLRSHLPAAWGKRPRVARILSRHRRPRHRNHRLPHVDAFHVPQCQGARGDLPGIAARRGRAPARPNLEVLALPSPG